MDLPAIASVAHERIECRVDALQPPLSPFCWRVARDLINPDADEIVGRIASNKERVLRKIMEGNADIEPRQADLRIMRAASARLSSAEYTFSGQYRCHNGIAVSSVKDSI